VNCRKRCAHLRIVIGYLAASLFSSIAGAATTNLLIGALHQNVVLQFSSTDNVVFTETTFLTITNPETMAFDGNGNLFVSTGNAIKRITPLGVKTTVAAELDVDGMAIDASGTLFVSRKSKNSNESDGVILRFTPNGKSSVFASNLSHPQGLAFDSSGNLYVAYPIRGTILKFTPDGRSTTFATGLSKPHRLAFDAFGDLFVTDVGANSIVEISASGVVTTIAMNTSDPKVTAVGDLAFDSNGNLFVTFGNTVVEFEIGNGAVPTTVASVPGGAGGIAIEPPATSNLSTRLAVQNGAGAAIVGFTITGSGPKQVLIRGLGASLSTFGVVNPLQDPNLDLHDSTGGVIATNDDWQTATNAAQIPIFMQPSDSREPAILATLQPGRFTAILRGKNNSGGIGLIEINDLSPDPSSKLTNVSTRGFVGTGENVMIAGLILSGGGGGRQILVRALGPTLSQSPFNIPGTLTDPTVTLLDANGTIVASNDDWKSLQLDEIQATGLAPPSEHESAILTTLPAGDFTAIVSGKNGQTGIALVDAFSSF